MSPYDTQTVIDAVEAASLAVGQASMSHYRSFAFGCPLRKAESPIEAVFFIWWRALETIETNTRGESHPEMFGYRLWPQLEVTTSVGSRFRLDFAVEAFKIAVELDGHDFHERTKDQVTYRNRRDRELQADGWTVMHISGSELLREPYRVVHSIYQFCFNRALDRLSVDLPPRLSQPSVS